MNVPSLNHSGLRLALALLGAVMLLASLPVAKSADPPRPGRVDGSGDPLPEQSLARLGSTRFRHASTITCLAFAPDGKSVATGSVDVTIRLWDRKTGEELRCFDGHRGGVTALAFTPDGKRLASSGHDGAVRVWDTATARELYAIAEQQFATPLAWSPDGKSLISATRQGMIQFSDAETGKSFRQLPKQRNPISGLALSPTGKHLATAGLETAVRLWDVESGKELRQLTNAHRGTSLAFSPDGKLLAMTKVLGAVAVCGVDSGKIVHEFRLPDSGRPFGRMAFSPNGMFLAAVCGDQSVRVWGLASGKELRNLDAAGFAIAFAPDGQTLAANGRGFSLRFWDLGQNKEIPTPPGHHHAVLALAFLPDKTNTLVSAGGDGTIRLWDAAKGKELDRMTEPGVQFGSIAVADDGGILSYGRELHDAESREPQVREWHPGTPHQARPLPVPNEFTSSPLLAPNAALLAWSNRQELRLLETGTGKELRRLPVENGGFVLAGFNQDGSRLAIGAARCVFLWDTATGKEICRVASDEKNLPFRILVAVAADGRSFVTVDSEVHLREALGGGERVRFVKPAPNISAAALSPDGRFVALGSQDGPIWLRDLATERDIGPLAGHRGMVRSIAFSADGQLLASGSLDTTILIWPMTKLVEKAKIDDVEKLSRAKLGDPSASVAHRAIRSLVAAPGSAVSLLKKDVQPVRPEDARKIARLIAELDSDEFDVREKATSELMKLRDLAEPSLRELLARQPPLEVRKRVEEIMGKERPSEYLRHLRAIEVLEYIGTAEARQVLQTISQGATEARLTQEATAALRRLARRPVIEP